MDRRVKTKCNYEIQMCKRKNRNRSRKKNKNNILRMTKDQQQIRSNLQGLQAPIFNIHIHVAPIVRHDLNMNIPRVQPVIHLHFDKHLLSAESRKNQSVGASSTKFQQTLPRLGDVKLHYDNITEKNDIRVSKLGGAEQCSSKYHFNDDSKMESCPVAENENISLNEEAVGCYGSSNSNISFRTNPDNNSTVKDTLTSELHERFKLKEAVVVLRDIFKTKYYQNISSANKSGICQSNKDQSCHTSGNAEYHRNTSENTENSRCSNRVVNEGLAKGPTQLEKESSGSASVTSDSLRRGSEINNENSINTVTGLCANGENTANDSSDINKALYPDMTFTNLAEGSNFSKILFRFREKKFVEDADNITN